MTKSCIGRHIGMQYARKIESAVHPRFWNRCLLAVIQTIAKFFPRGTWVRVRTIPFCENDLLHTL